MKKHIFIVNGMARSGKDTFANFLMDMVPTMKVSSVDKVKLIARQCGWDGGKTERDRRFLSDLKCLLSDYNDLPFLDISMWVERFKSNGLFEVLLIDVREPFEIDKAKRAFGAKTILIKNNRVPQIMTNMADAGVYNYMYDYTIENNGSLEEFKEKTERFVREVLGMEPRETEVGEYECS